MRAKIVLILLLLAFIPISLKAADAIQPRLLRVSLIDGDVTYLRTDLNKWVDLSINTPILEGDKVWVGRDGRAEIEFEDGSYVRMAENTVVEFSQLGAETGSSPVQLRVSQGLVTFGVNSENGPFVVETPLFTVQFRRVGSFRIDVDPDQSARVVVFEGNAEIQSQAASLFLQGGETLRFLSDDPERYYLQADYEKDEWDLWNVERDQYLAQLSRQRHYSNSRDWNYAELDAYGSWYDLPTYGQVWRPNCDSDWAPFRMGRWVWYDSFGWTWISYEPWGWIPYHYGRWTMVNGYGWCWAPYRVFDPWCPGAVSWVQGPAWVAWVPLAPNESWHPRSKISVNEFISKNYHARNGVTYLPRDSFVNGTPPSAFTPPSDPLRSGHVIPGQPGYRPTAMSRMPVVDTMAARKYNNDDLTTRRNTRDQIIQSTVPAQALTPRPSAGVPSQVEQRRNLRDQIIQQPSKVQTVGGSTSSSSGIRVIEGGSSLHESGSRTDASDGSDKVLSVRDSERLRQTGETRNRSDSRLDAREERPQGVPVSTPATGGTSTSPLPARENLREDLRQVLRSRAEENAARSSGRQVREWSTPTTSGSTSGSSAPPSRVEPPTSRPQPNYEPKPITAPSSPAQVTSPPPAPAPRVSAPPAESRSSGSSERDNRSSARTRADR